MNYRFCVAIVATMLIGYGCKTAKSVVKTNTAPTTAVITEEDLLTCFAANTMLDGKPVWCEVSAVLFDGTKLLFANDKDMPSGLSPVFTKPLASLADSTLAPAYLTQSAYINAHKYEDFAQTPDGKFVFLTTAFDRIKPGSHDWDGFNTILYWHKGDEQNPRVLAPDDTSRTSMAYRQRIAQLLASDEFPGEMPYFKIEGLAATDRQLLFGIREEGKAFDNFKYRSKIISVSYQIEPTNGSERIRLANDWKIIADFDPGKAEASLPQPLALSSLEYDAFRNRFWLLTSLELNGKLDAYLWTATSDELMNNKPFTLIRNAQGQPLTIGHKAEDVTPLDKNRLLLIHDDDRVLTTVGKRTRQSNQAAYTILTIK